MVLTCTQLLYIEMADSALCGAGPVPLALWQRRPVGGAPAYAWASPGMDLPTSPSTEIKGRTPSKTMYQEVEPKYMKKRT
jgi:hypothetical protein